MSKAYANRKPQEQRPKNDLYHTPKSLIWELMKFEDLRNSWECAAGHWAISNELFKKGLLSVASDLETIDFLNDNAKFPAVQTIITNPPFSLWDDFVFKAKEHNPEKIVMLGRTNYLGTYNRSKSGIWDELEYIYVFNRMVDYQTPFRKDGLFHVGALVTGWFVWNKGYTGEPKFKSLDVQKYAKLGAFKKIKRT